MAQQVSPTDLTGLFNIQTNYLAGLVQQSNSDTADPTALNSKVLKLQGELTNLYTKFKDANVSSMDVLDKQRETSAIINDEKERLLQKKQSIDNALIGKQRAIALNDSYRLRQTQITRIKVTMVITLAICIFLVLLGRRYPALPSILITLLILIVLLIGVVYSLFIYSEISSRSKLNYNELDLGGPKVLSPEEEKAARLKAYKKGDLLGTINPLGCIGSDCCSKETVWDKEQSKCVLPANEAPADALSEAGVSPFTTMSKNALVHSPSEYDSYGRV